MTGSRPPVRPTSELRNNQEGVSLGGPIVKNHTFFFMNYEQQNYRQALTAPGTTPSAAWVSASRGSDGERWRAGEPAHA